MNKKSILFLSTIFLLLAAVMFLVSEARANMHHGDDNLTFDLDFNPVEGEISYETSWGLNLNESVIIDVYVSNVHMLGLRHMGFTIEYNTTQLTIVNNSASMEDIWLFTEPGIDINPDKGEIKMFGGAGAGICGKNGDHIRLGTFELKCIALGTSNLLFFDSDHGGKDYDDNFDDFTLLNDLVLDDQIPEEGIFMGTISSNVPIPGSFLLLACGLFGLALLKRERS